MSFIAFQFMAMCLAVRYDIKTKRKDGHPLDTHQLFRELSFRYMRKTHHKSCGVVLYTLKISMLSDFLTMHSSWDVVDSVLRGSEGALGLSGASWKSPGRILQ